MNPTPHLLTITLALFLAGCASNALESAEEAAYLKFVSERESGVKLDTAQLKKIHAMQEQAYAESGIPEFMKNGEEKTMDDMDKFYNEVIVGKYAVSPMQGYLKGKFIQYEINYFDLTHTQNPEELKKLATLTRELMDSKYHDGQFIYECLSACRETMEKEEYNALVQRAKFEVRFVKDQTNKLIELESNKATSTDRERKLKTGRVEMMRVTIKSLERSIADLETLRME